MAETRATVRARLFQYCIALLYTRIELISDHKRLFLSFVTIKQNYETYTHKLAKT